MTKYNKLVRDNIPEIIKSRGGNPVTHLADDKEYRIKLKEKLQEEVTEFLAVENAEEMADILEVIDAICAAWNFNKEDLSKIKAAKKADRGGFEKKIILEES